MSLSRFEIAARELSRSEPIVRLVLELQARHAQVGGLARTLLGEEMPRLGLPPAERRAVAGAFYRLFRLRRRIEYALHLAARRLPDADRARAAYFVALVLDGVLAPDEAAERAGLPRGRLAWQLVQTVDARLAAEPDPVLRFGLTHSVPDWLAARFLAEFGAAAADVAAGLNGLPPLVVRANTLKTTREALRAAFHAAGCTAEPTPHAPHGLIVDGDVNLFSMPPYREGAFEQQDEASQLCAHVVAPPPRGSVLDVCAGSGGKTLALAAAMQNTGAILATDVSRFKLEELVQRRRRAGTDNVRSKVVRADAWPQDVVDFARQADRILVDAPCDGVGSWRRRPDARWRLREEHLATVQRKQAMLLARAAACLAPGARVVYATCTIFHDQNERPLAELLARDRELEVVPIAEVLGRAAAAGFTDDSGRFLRTFPHRHGADGFFAAVLRRRRIPRG
jgi:16S rRNA (cytosine967-C5)-methyltransferase